MTYIHYLIWSEILYNIWLWSVFTIWGCELSQVLLNFIHINSWGCIIGLRVNVEVYKISLKGAQCSVNFFLYILCFFIFLDLDSFLYLHYNQYLKGIFQEFNLIANLIFLHFSVFDLFSCIKFQSYLYTFLFQPNKYVYACNNFKPMFTR